MCILMSKQKHRVNSGTKVSAFLLRCRHVHTSKKVMIILGFQSVTTTIEWRYNSVFLSWKLWSLLGRLICSVSPEDSPWAGVRPLLEQRPCCCGVCARLRFVTLGQASGPRAPERGGETFVQHNT